MNIKQSKNHLVLSITGNCSQCNEPWEVLVHHERFNAWRRGGVLIQVAMPELTPDQHELLQTGICSKCWENLKDPELTDPELAEGEPPDLRTDKERRFGL